MIITKDNLRDIRAKHSTETIGFVTGAYHILHPGHAWFLKECKRNCNIFVVAIADDEITKYKRKTHLNTDQRMYLVDSLKAVDYTVKEEMNMPPHNVSGLVRLLQPNTWFTNSDNPNLETYLNLIRKQNRHSIRQTYMKITARNDNGIYNISTSEIIRRIRNSHDKR